MYFSTFSKCKSCQLRFYELKIDRFFQWVPPRRIITASSCHVVLRLCNNGYSSIDPMFLVFFGGQINNHDKAVRLIGFSSNRPRLNPEQRNQSCYRQQFQKYALLHNYSQHHHWHLASCKQKKVVCALTNL